MVSRRRRLAQELCHRCVFGGEKAAHQRFGVSEFRRAGCADHDGEVGTRRAWLFHNLNDLSQPAPKPHLTTNFRSSRYGAVFAKTVKPTPPY